MGPARPSSDRYPTPFATYVDAVPEGEVLDLLQDQLAEVEVLFGALTEAQGGFRYAPGKWSLKDLLQHLLDGERVFAFRCLCIGRGEAASLPGFDEDAYAAVAAADRRSLRELLDEWHFLRASSLALFQSLSNDDWQRVGTANQKSVVAAVFPYIAMGHVAHHLGVIRERYLPGLM